MGSDDSDDGDDSIENRNPIVDETKIHGIVFVCISLLHPFEIYYNEGINTIIFPKTSNTLLYKFKAKHSSAYPML